jgi:hypothetical protein
MDWAVEAWVWAPLDFAGLAWLVGELVRSTSGQWISATHALPARSRTLTGSHASRAPAVFLRWRSHHLDVHLWRHGLRATCDPSMPCSGRRCRSAVTGVETLPIWVAARVLRPARQLSVKNSSAR